MSDDKFKATIKVLNKETRSKDEPPLMLTGKDILDSKQHEEALSTGIESLNYVLNGGFYPGRIYEVAGMSAVGKSSASFKFIANAQKEGHRCVFIDMEHTFDAKYAMACGINLELLGLARPQDAEEAMTAVHEVARSGTAKLIVVDSVAQLIPKAEANKTMDKESIGIHARFVTKALKKINPMLQLYGTVLILINQIRVKMEGHFVSKTTTGGNMLHYACTGRLEMKRKEWIGKQDNIYGQRCEIKATKHKMGPPMRSCSIDIVFGQGIDEIADLANVLVDNEFSGVEQAGSWIKVDGESLCQGIDRFKDYLRENETERERLRKRFKTIMSTDPVERPNLSFESISSTKSKKSARSVSKETNSS